MMLNVYRDAPATEQEIVNQTGRLLLTYPKIDAGIQKELVKAIMRAGLTGKQLKDAVDMCISSEEWFSISKIINFQRKIKLYTYNEALIRLHQQGISLGAYYVVTINKEPYRVMKSDCVQWGINIEKLRNYLAR